MGIFGIAPGRHSAQSAFRPAMVGIRPLLRIFHWSAFRRSAFGHAPIKMTAMEMLEHLIYYDQDSTTCTKQLLLDVFPTVYPKKYTVARRGHCAQKY